MGALTIKRINGGTGGRLVKRRQIVKAATWLFLSNGYERTSMDAVATRAGVSKPTVYNHFANKEALFGAIVEQLCDDLMSGIVSAEAVDQAPRERLTAIGRRFLNIALGADAITLYRIVIAEAPRFPDLAAAFYENGPARVARGLADYFAGETAAGRLDIKNPTGSAEQYLGLLLGQIHLRALLGVGPSADDGVVEHLDSAVEMFLRAHRKAK